MRHASFERAILENQKVISINKQTYIYVNYTLIYFFYSTNSIIQRIVIRIISVKFYRMTRKRMRDGKNEESAAKSRGQKRRVRTAARAALAEVVEPATQLHARTNTTAYLTHTSRRCMHCAVHADARTIPLLFSPFAIHFVPPPFSPSLSFTLLHPIHPSFSRPSSFLYPTLVSLIPSFSTFSPSSSLHFLSLAVPHLPPFLLLLRLSVLSSRSFSPFSMPPSSTNTMLFSLSLMSPPVFVLLDDSVSVVTRGSLCITRCSTPTTVQQPLFEFTPQRRHTHVRIVIVAHFPRLSSSSSPSMHRGARNCAASRAPANLFDTLRQSQECIQRFKYLFESLII